MTISTNSAAGVAAFNGATGNTLADLARAYQLGSALRAMPVRLYGKAPLAAAANPYVHASAMTITLPDDAKAALIHRAYARAGTGSVGALTIDTADPTGAAAQPSAAHIAISPSGDLVFNGSDAWTLVDVLYLPEPADVIELSLPVASNTLTLPTFAKTTAGIAAKAVILMEAEVLAGTATGKKIVDSPATSVSAGHAALNNAKTTVTFASADAATSARVKLGIYKALDFDTFLEAAQNFITGGSATSANTQV